MTSRDVRDILSLPSQSTAPSVASAPTKKHRSKARPRADGISRELYALIGDNASPLTLGTLQQPKFKARLKGVQQQQKTGKWKRCEFENSARKDGLKLKHWVRTVEDQTPPEETYRFAKYNTNANPFSYSTEEYLHHLRDDDWTREETDYLFSLLTTYDLRFPIIHDRYEYPSANPNSQPRTVESLKARYYSICQKLLAARPAADEAERKAQIASYNFDPQREADRKAHVVSLIQRTPAQIAEEDFLYIESRRLEQNAVRFNQDRETLMATLGGMTHKLLTTDTTAAGLAIGLSATASAASLAKKSRRGDTAGLDLDLVEPIYGAGQKVSKATLLADALNCVFRFEGPTPTQFPPVTLRSSRIALPKSALSSKIVDVMRELGMPSSGKELVMPTRANVSRFEDLQATATTLVELKRSLERVEADLKVHRRKKEMLGGGVGATPAPTAGGSGATDLEEPKSTRAASLALKRSPSVSSVGSTTRERKKARRG